MRQSLSYLLMFVVIIVVDFLVRFLENHGGVCSVGHFCVMNDKNFKSTVKLWVFNKAAS